MTIFATVYLDEFNQDCNKICQFKKKKNKRNRTKSIQRKRDTRKESKKIVR